MCRILYFRKDRPNTLVSLLGVSFRDSTLERGHSLCSWSDARTASMGGQGTDLFVVEFDIFGGVLMSAFTILRRENSGLV